MLAMSVGGRVGRSRGRLDDLGHGDAELVVDEDHLAARHQPVVHQDVDRLADLGAPVLMISQFTLYGDARKGRRPTWLAAAPGEVSEPLYRAVCAGLEEQGTRVERGVFGADMTVELANDGPVTMILES